MPDSERAISFAETWTAVVLGLTTVLSAWIGYQASTWSSSMSTNYSKAGKYHREALKVDNRIGQQAIIDRNAFDRWTIAAEHKEPALATTIERRFSPGLQRSYQEWKREGSPAGSTPLDLPIYAEPGVEEADLEVKANQASDRAEYANRVHDEYILIEIGTATALFFLGLSSLGKQGRIRVAYIGVGTLAFLSVAVATAIWPKQM